MRWSGPESLRAVLVPVADLREDPANVRTHSARSVEGIARSLTAFGQRKPVVALVDGTVIAGNGLLAAAVRLGWDHVAAVRVEDSLAEARAFAIADNRTAELSSWNFDALTDALAELGELSVDLEDLGWTGFELDGLLNSPSVIPPDTEGLPQHTPPPKVDALPETDTRPKYIALLYRTPEERKVWLDRLGLALSNKDIYAVTDL